MTAMEYYNLESAEMDTLPSIKCDLKNCPARPLANLGREYSLVNVEKLAYRRLATLSGAHELELEWPEEIILGIGKIIFDERYLSSLAKSTIVMTLD